MPAHIRAALTGVNLSIPLIEGRLALGTWQGIYLFEHRRAPHRRSPFMQSESEGREQREISLLSGEQGI
jgi:secondary thiamine-phosphate synthase enzyme